MRVGTSTSQPKKRQNQHEHSKHNFFSDVLGDESVTHNVIDVQISEESRISYYSVLT